MTIARLIGYVFSGRNDGGVDLKRTVGDALGGLVCLLSSRCRIHECASEKIVLEEQDFLDGQRNLFIFTGPTRAMAPLYAFAERLTRMRSEAALDVPMSDAPPPMDVRYVALAETIGSTPQQAGEIATMSHARLAIALRFHIDLGVPMSDILRTMREDPKTVGDLTGDHIDKADLDALGDLTKDAPPGTCPIALARELRTGAKIDPRACGWSA